MLPKLVIVKLLHLCVMWMNSFPVKSGVSDKYSPRELVSRHKKLDAKLHCKTLFQAYCELHTDPDITNTMEPSTSYIFMSLTTGKRIVRCKFTEISITNSVKKQVAKWALKDCAITGLKFMDKYRIKYKFDKEEDTIIEVRPIDVTPYPDIPAEVPGIMTQYKNLINGENIIEDEPGSSNKEQAMLAAENSRLEFEPIGESFATGEVFELLDNDKNDVLDKDIRHDKEMRVKEEPQWAKITDKDEDGQDEDNTNKTNKEQPRRLGREQAPPKQLKDYEVYATIKQEDEFMFTTCTDDDITCHKPPKKVSYIRTFGAPDKGQTLDV
jgi:hypothetical protein